MTIAEQKRCLRTEVRRMERQLTNEYRQQSTDKIVASVKKLPEYQAAHCIFCFVGTKREIDTRTLLQDILSQGKRLCVPLCVEDGIMELREITSLTQLAPGAYGILEPATDTKKVQLQEIDLSVIPCVSCDREGHRLGQGGGYYDRLFAQETSSAVMLCREQLLSVSIPTEPFDQIFPCVVTETGVYRRGQPVNAEDKYDFSF